MLVVCALMCNLWMQAEAPCIFKRLHFDDLKLQTKGKEVMFVRIP